MVGASRARAALYDLRRMATPYPRWRYFPSYAPPPPWVVRLVGVFATHQSEIDSAIVYEERKESDDVLRAIAEGLRSIGFTVEKGKARTGKLPRPVFFGDEGTFLRTYEIDTFEPTKGIALEVEAVARRWGTPSTET